MQFISFHTTFCITFYGKSNEKRYSNGKQPLHRTVNNFEIKLAVEYICENH